MNEISHSLKLRPTLAGDVDFVLSLERHPDNRPFILQWSRDEHVCSIEFDDHEHYIIESTLTGDRLGYIIVYNLVEKGLGLYIKRIVVGEKSRRIGRNALRMVLERAFHEFNALTVYLAVFPDNKRAQRSYRAMGFTGATLLPQEYLELENAVGGLPENSILMYAWPRSRR